MDEFCATRTVSTLSMRGRCTSTGDVVTWPAVKVKTRLTPAYLPGGLVAVVPLNPTSCGPTHVGGRFASRKLPPPSETAPPAHPVVLPLPSFPNMVMVTPASGVSRESETTVRPRRDVVGDVTVRETLAVWVRGSPG